MSTSFKEVMKILKEEKKLYDKEQRALKKEHNRLTRAVKKAAHQAPSSLDSFADMHYSDREVNDYLSGTSYMETYNAMKGHDEY